MEILPPWQPEDGPSSLALTPHQREIALLVGEGLTNREIAGQLGTTLASILHSVSA
jgi:DNA-binding NarL/FixJ family response regulator